MLKKLIVLALLLLAATATLSQDKPAYTPTDGQKLELENLQLKVTLKNTQLQILRQQYEAGAAESQGMFDKLMAKAEEFRKTNKVPEGYQFNPSTLIWEKPGTSNPAK